MADLMTMLRRLIGGPAIEEPTHTRAAADERIEATHRLAQQRRRLLAIDKRIDQERGGR